MTQFRVVIIDLNLNRCIIMIINRVRIALINSNVETIVTLHLDQCEAFKYTLKG